MFIKSAKFIGSYTSAESVKSDPRPEVAFIGRSNVGKSSLINMLCQQKALAHTSSTPGKTRVANRFLINEYWVLTDLPGYGYAKVSKKERDVFKKLIEDYLIGHATLKALCVLIDSRIPPQAIDLEFLFWCGEHDLPFFLAFTKCEKMKAGEREKNLNAFFEAFRNSGYEDIPDYFLTSANTGEGREELLKFIQTDALID